MTGQERPTATITRIDLSAGRDGASAAPADPEATLFRAYGAHEWTPPTIEERPCACGGTVKADPTRPAPGVAAHQFTSRHKAWRANREDD